MLPLRISETSSRLACSRQLRCVVQLGPVISVLKPGGGMSMWKRPLLPRGKLSRPGRLVKALRASYDAAKCISRHSMHLAYQEANKKAYENIDPESSEVYCLANQF